MLNHRSSSDAFVALGEREREREREQETLLTAARLRVRLHSSAATKAQLSQQQ
jgi:hypothetical protein